MIFKNILNKESKVIISAALVIGFFSLLSRILGLVRNRIFADMFGAGDEMDIYFAAFRAPDLIYNILIIGAVGAVFMPVFFEYLEKKGKKDAMELTSNILNIFTFGVVAVSFALYFFADSITAIFVYGFDKEKMRLTAEMTKIMLLSPVFLGMSSILGNLLQAKKMFLPFALAPVLYNIGIIFGALFFTDSFGVLGLAYGVVLGALLHFLIQIPPALKVGFKFTPSFNIFHPGLKEMLLLSGPRVAGLLAYQLNFIVITAIGSSLSSGSIAVFNFANDLQYIPIGIIALSFVTAAFPSLSESFAKKNISEFLNKFYSTTNQILFLVIPISVFLILERAQIVRVILGTGQFSWEDTRLTAATLGIFALSVFAQSLVPLFSRAFFALGDTKTPVLINVSSLILNIGLSFYFVDLIKDQGVFYETLASMMRVHDISDISILGLPFAFSISSVINLLWLYFALSSKIDSFSGEKILFSITRINLAVLVMGLAVYPTLRLMAEIINMQSFVGIFLQGFAAFLVGLFVYLWVSYWLKIPEFFAFWQAFTLPVKKIFLSKVFPTQVNGSEKL